MSETTTELTEFCVMPFPVNMAMTAFSFAAFSAIFIIFLGAILMLRDSKKPTIWMAFFLGIMLGPVTMMLSDSLHLLVFRFFP